ncbi:hypothetical protein GWI33_010255 [Rhynchophorus ferrugineus]|uniref:Uncharacterized protein n=1 Tax=Rhynchophorus ferrugineus TaxID=354439 RepID=A0A834IB39_RHYFE|nr:hypothetical protein GWI33_010255 [Rhynchophorus ferrugineus]
MDLQEDLIRLDLDCSPSKFETVSSRKGVHPKLAIAPDALVYFRQEPGRKKKFLFSAWEMEPKFLGHLKV